MMNFHAIKRTFVEQRAVLAQKNNPEAWRFRAIFNLNPKHI